MSEPKVINSDVDILNCNNENKYSTECNKLLLKKELSEHKYLEKYESNSNILYPNLNDPNFNTKIALKKEFNDTKYDGTIYKDIKAQSDLLNNAEFELSPHQSFVRNFLSFQTPYNSLLLYHGLGSGKTCSAIGVSEEMRDYLKQTGMSKRIIIVAAENVQDNFKLQIFDERKLKKNNGIWNIKGCVGNKLLKEINPTNMEGLTHDQIVSQINTLINNSYLFLGYGQFANYIIKTSGVDDTQYKSPRDKNKIMLRNFKNEFNNRLIIIDEIHNIRMTEDNENKKVAMNLELLVKSVDNMRLLLLSATPMYNSYKEIVWLLNLMNINDKRGTVELKDIFDKTGNLTTSGEELLIRKATGYISFVRGENPYTFPYRVYPDVFSLENTFKNENNIYPKYQMNEKQILPEDHLKIINVYLSNIGEYQSYGYKHIINYLKNKSSLITTTKGVEKQMPTFENMESFGYTILQKPIESLIIVYPYDGLDTINQITNNSTREQTAGANKKNDFGKNINPTLITGRAGLERVIKFTNTITPPFKGDFEYKSDIEKKYGRIFAPDQIGKYSYKIKKILDSIYSTNNDSIIVSEGVILIYSQYIYGGLIPVALALEEMGFTRFSTSSNKLKQLFKERKTPPIDVRTMKPKQQNQKDFMPARYLMITGDSALSPNNDSYVKMVTNENNKDGHQIKVILISKSGSEGIDLKFIRQVHILEPWYNMNRIEQIIGRAVRNFSHKDLTFEKRNVQIFMYATLLENKDEEAADLYVYRVAEVKSIQIGRVSRILKEVSVDCLINHDQTNFTQEIFSKKSGIKVKQVLSNGTIIEDFKIGDAPYSAACDYMENCEYKCRPNNQIDENKLNQDTYNESYIMTNTEKIIYKIKLIFKEGFFYKKKKLLQLINIPKKYPLDQIYYALTRLVENNNDSLLDKYGRVGHLINIGEYYLFQPNEINYENISIFDRSVPIDLKHQFINFEIKQDITKPVYDNRHNAELQNNVISSDTHQSAKNILNESQINFELALEFRNKEKINKENKQNPVNKDNEISRGDDNWFKHYGKMMYMLHTQKDIKNDDLIDFLIQHICDVLFLNETLQVLNYLYSVNIIKDDSFEYLVKEYFIKNSITIKIHQKSLTCILLCNEAIPDSASIFTFNNINNTWNEAEPEDKNDILLNDDIRNEWTINKNKLNNIIGFISTDNKNKYKVFKTKDTTIKRNSGARCDEAGKTKTIKLLNDIVGVEWLTKENTKKLVQIELCIIQEIFLRFLNKNKTDNKIWFLNSNIAVFNKI
jgi:hypothetical protein